MICVVAIIAAGLAACTSRRHAAPSRPPPPSVASGQATVDATGGGILRLGGDVTIELYPGSLPAGSQVSVRRADTSAPTGGGPSAVVAPFDITTAAPLAKPARLSIQLPAARRPTGDGVVALASLDGANGWSTVDATYDPASGQISGIVPHFSVWTALSWLGDKIAASFWSALRALIGPAATASAGVGQPTCAGSARDVIFEFTPPADGSLNWCAGRSRDGSYTVKIRNARAYTVSLAASQPATVENNGGLAAIAARLLTTLPGADPYLLEVGADATFRLAPNSHVDVRVLPSGIGFALDVLKTAVDELLLVTGKPSDNSVRDKILKAYSAGACEASVLGGDPPTGLSPELAGTIAKWAFDCAEKLVKTAVPGAAGIITSVFSVLVNLLVNFPYEITQFLYDAQHGSLLRYVGLTTPAPVTSPATRPAPAPTSTSPPIPTPTSAPAPTPTSPPTPAPTPGPTTSTTANSTSPPPPDVTSYDCPNMNNAAGHYVPQGYYWNNDFTAQSATITHGWVLVGADANGARHQVTVGISATLGTHTSPAQWAGPTFTAEVSGYGGINWTAPSPIHVTPGQRYYFTVTASNGDFTAYDNTNAGDCFIGSAIGY
jgi:hypothetical protein